MSTNQWFSEVTSRCPKAMWIVNNLVDDETDEAPSTLPSAVDFHLAKCESCRTLVNKLRSTTRDLALLAAREVDESLFERATDRAHRAIADGGRLTGRVEFPKESDITANSGSARSFRHRSAIGLAAAAAIAIVAFGVYELRQSRTKPSVAPVVAKNNETPEYQAAQAIPNPRSVQSQVAQPVVAAGVTRQTPWPRPIRHRSVIEAAMADEPGAVQYGVALPDPEERGVGWLRWFDNRTENTVSEKSQERP